MDRKPDKSGAARPAAADNESFVALIAAARDDRAIRERVLAIAGLDAFNRNSMLNTILADLRLKGAPAELAESLAMLKDDGIALHVRKILGAG